MNSNPPGIFGGARVPGPISGWLRPELARPAAPKVRSNAAPAKPAVPTVGEDYVRQRFLAVRRRMRELMGPLKVPRDGMLLYSGIPDEIRPDVMKALATATQKHDTVYIDQTSPGQYLEAQSKGFLTDYLGTDWSISGTFSEGGAQYMLSILGFWRELSALFAKKASGEVHVVVPKERLNLADKGALLREARATASREAKISDLTTMSWKDLKTFGFVEFPILYGQISKNMGVTEVRLYEWSGGTNVKFVAAIAPKD